MKIRFTKRNIIVIELIGVLLLHTAELVIRFPCNHTNKLMFCYRDCICALAIFELIYSFVKREVCVTFWIILTLSFTIPTIENKFNILVPYDTWTSRGMPDWGEYCTTNVDERDTDELKRRPTTQILNSKNQDNRPLGKTTAHD